MFQFSTTGVCAKKIEFDIVEDKVANVVFHGGCNGNLNGISKLIEGMEVEEVVDKLSGLGCGMRATSCPDQLAKALEMVAKNK